MYFIMCEQMHGKKIQKLAWKKSGELLVIYIGPYLHVVDILHQHY